MRKVNGSLIGAADNEVVPIAKGGTGETTTAKAVSALGLVPKTLIDKPLGLVGLDSEGFIGVAPGSSASVNIEGSVVVDSDIGTLEWIITDFDSNTVYTIESGVFPATLNGSVIAIDITNFNSEVPVTDTIKINGRPLTFTINPVIGLIKSPKRESTNTPPRNLIIQLRDGAIQDFYQTYFTLEYFIPDGDYGGYYQNFDSYSDYGGGDWPVGMVPGGMKFRISVDAYGMSASQYEQLTFTTAVNETVGRYLEQSSATLGVNSPILAVASGIGNTVAAPMLEVNSQKHRLVVEKKPDPASDYSAFGIVKDSDFISTHYNEFEFQMSQNGEVITWYDSTAKKLCIFQDSTYSDLVFHTHTEERFLPAKEFSLSATATLNHIRIDASGSRIVTLSTESNGDLVLAVFSRWPFEEWEKKTQVVVPFIPDMNFESMPSYNTSLAISGNGQIVYLGLPETNLDSENADTTIATNGRQGFIYRFVIEEVDSETLTINTGIADTYFIPGYFYQGYNLQTNFTGSRIFYLKQFGFYASVSGILVVDLIDPAGGPDPVVSEIDMDLLPVNSVEDNTQNWYNAICGIDGTGTILAQSFISKVTGGFIIAVFVDNGSDFVFDDFYLPTHYQYWHWQSKMRANLRYSGDEIIQLSTNVDDPNWINDRHGFSGYRYEALILEKMRLSRSFIKTAHVEVFNTFDMSDGSQKLSIVRTRKTDTMTALGVPYAANGGGLVDIGVINMSDQYQSLFQIRRPDTGLPVTNYGFGYAVKLLNDEILVVSEPDYDEYRGRVHIYKLTHANYVYETTLVTTLSGATAGIRGYAFGEFIDGTADGKRIFIAQSQMEKYDAENDEWPSVPGGVHVFDCDVNGVWNRTQIVIPENIYQNANFGSTISCSNNGKYLVVSCDDQTDELVANRGGVFVFRHDGTSFVFNSRIDNPVNPGYELDSRDFIGGELARISDDGLTLVAIQDDYVEGNFGSKVVVFGRNTDTDPWVAVKTLDMPNVNNSISPYSISMSADGNLIVVGTSQVEQSEPLDGNYDAIHIFNRGQNNTWHRTQEELDRDDDYAPMGFGRQVSLNPEGSRIGFFGFKNEGVNNNRSMITTLTEVSTHNFIAKQIPM